MDLGPSVQIVETPRIFSGPNFSRVVFDKINFFEYSVKKYPVTIPIAHSKCLLF